MINARAETIATRGAFKHAFKKRRCIIPADGFYEWTKAEGQAKKQPWFIHRPDGEPMAFAGLWEVWRTGGQRGRAAVLHDHHRRAQREDGRDPRPDAGDAAP